MQPESVTRIFVALPGGAVYDAVTGQPVSDLGQGTAKVLPVVESRSPWQLDGALSRTAAQAQVVSQRTAVTQQLAAGMTPGARAGRHGGTGLIAAPAPARVESRAQPRR